MTKNSNDYLNPSDFEDSKDWFSYCAEVGEDEANEGMKREAPFRDFDACLAYLDGYDCAKCR